MKKIIVIMSLIVGFILSWSMAWGSFYVVVAAGQKAKRTILVSPNPSNATVSGENLLAAIAKASTASAADQWLILLEPGLYDVGTVTCVVPAFVHLEGTGPNITIIRSSSLYALDLTGTSQIRGLSVERTSGAQSNGYGIIVRDGLPVITNVKVSAAATNLAVGIWTNVLDKLVLNNVHIDVAGTNFSTGILLQSTNTELFDVNVQAHGGMDNSGIIVYTTNGNIPKVVLQHGNIEVWDSTFPSDGNQAGIEVTEGKMTIKDSYVEATSGNNAYGLSCSTDADVQIYNSEFTAHWADQYNYGVFNSNSARIQMKSSSATAFYNGNANGWAILNANSGGLVFIEHSEIGGKVRNDSGNSIFIGSSKFLAGIGSVSGSVTCASVWDQAYTFFASSCP